MPDTRGTKTIESPAASLSKPPKTSNPGSATLADLSSTLKDMCRQMKEMSEKQSNFESQLATSINSVGDIIDKKIDLLRDDLHNEFSGRIHQNEVDISELQDKNVALEETCASLIAQVEKLRGDSIRHEDRYNELSDQVEFQQKEADLVVRGIPAVRNEICVMYFQKIAAAIGFTPAVQPTIDAFRLGRKKPGAVFDPPVLFRFRDKYTKSEFFQKYLGKLDLKLSDIGFIGDGRVYVAESLTSRRQKIFQEALKMKKDKKIASVKSSFGAIQIKRAEKDAFVPVRRLSDL